MALDVVSISLELWVMGVDILELPALGPPHRKITFPSF